MVLSHWTVSRGRDERRSTWFEAKKENGNMKSWSERGRFAHRDSEAIPILPIFHLFRTI